ncbi:glutamate receptor ionotropic, delta-1 [Trichonephila clavipes]|nr:glutamate receptor ionotropic, delta-1 [Trichonephila clavipes]
MFEVNVSDDGKAELSGVEGKFLSLLSSILKFKYHLASPPFRDWGRIDENGNWTGLMGMVHRKEVDFALSTLTITEDRMEAVHFTTPYTIEDVTFLVEKPDPEELSKFEEKPPESTITEREVLEIAAIGMYAHATVMRAGLATCKKIPGVSRIVVVAIYNHVTRSISELTGVSLIVALKDSCSAGSDAPE